MTDNALSNDEIITRDPILRVLCRKWNWSDTRIILTASLVAAFIFLVPGGLASASYHPAQASDGIAGDIPLITLWTLIFSPILWGFYIWQARTLSQIFSQLDEKGVLGRLDSKARTENIEKTRAVFRSSTHPILFLIAFILVAGYWGMRITSQSDLYLAHGKYWFEVKWYLPLYIIAWSLALYVMYGALLRQIVFIAEISTLFRKIEIQVNPLDSDEVGGLAPVSQLISGTLMFAIGFGLLISIFILVGHYLRGINVFERPDMLGAFGLYVVLAPFCLFVPTLAVRNAMLRARSKILAPIADEFRKIIEQANIADQGFKEQNERLKELQERYDTILETYPVVPLSKGLLRIFSLAASVPYLSSVIPIAIDWLTANKGITP